ncbi:MAG: DUF2460 domain-containing protein [Planctomycetes bacterium]|nr:DUF2460 domain-containing protein [Planctomycetota bacterium]
MSYHDVELPDDFQYGSQFGAGFATTPQETASGHQYQIARQAAPRHRMRLRKELLDRNQLAVLKTFALARRGALHTWKVKDWSDFTTAENGTDAPTSLDVILGSGDGSRQAFQLVKTYAESDPGELDRVIELPVAATLLVAENGTPTTAYTLTSPGGIITFNTAPAIGVVVTAGFEFRVPVRFDLSVDEWNALRADDFNIWSLADLTCSEALSEVEYPERTFPGGTQPWGAVSGDVSLSLAQGSLHTIAPTTAINAFLPAPPTLFPGGLEVLALSVTTGAAGSVQPRDDAGNAVGSPISAGNVVRFAAAVSGGTLTWIRF